MARAWYRSLVVIAVVLGFTGVPRAAHLPSSAAATSFPVVVAAGDIACASSTPGPQICRHGPVSDLILALQPTAVLDLGDIQYENGELANFEDYYDPTWGRFMEITYPTPGNHEYGTSGAAGYFEYFGSRAPGPYYSFDLAPNWHVIALNSEIARGEGSPQNDWLEADLAATSANCVLAFWHRPRFWSGVNYNSDLSMAPFWEDLYAARADLILVGHAHNYERFADLTPAGAVDWATGVRSFVVGTGGKDHHPFGTPITGSQFRNATDFGVLKLTLKLDGFLWAFVNESGVTLDSGSGACQ
jgi:acid phosphatase type 7